MVLDSSAIVAIFLKEPGHGALIRKLAAAKLIGVGAPTLVETGIVLSVRLGRAPWPLLARFLQEFEVIVVPFSEVHWTEALGAYRQFGKGRHAAALNFGDCLGYAVARVAGQPLLCVGDDFSRTDLPLA